MGSTKSLPLIRQNSSDNRRRSEQSETGSIKEPTPVKQPPAVVPLVKEHTKPVQLSERDIAFLSSQTGRNDDMKIS
jgi:hypothetical protein